MHQHTSCADAPHFLTVPKVPLSSRPHWWLQKSWTGRREHSKQQLCLSEQNSRRVCIHVCGRVSVRRQPSSFVAYFVYSTVRTTYKMRISHLLVLLLLSGEKLCNSTLLEPPCPSKPPRAFLEVAFVPGFPLPQAVCGHWSLSSSFSTTHVWGSLQVLFVQTSRALSVGTIFDTDVSGMSSQHGPTILVCCTDPPGCCWLTNLTSLETFFFFVDNIETCQLLKFPQFIFPCFFS